MKMLKLSKELYYAWNRDLKIIGEVYGKEKSWKQKDLSSKSSSS
jgi:hypothetical protein